VPHFSRLVTIRTLRKPSVLQLQSGSLDKCMFLGPLERICCIELSSYTCIYNFSVYCVICVRSSCRPFVCNGLHVFILLHYLAAFSAFYALWSCLMTYKDDDDDGKF